MGKDDQEGKGGATAAAAIVPVAAAASACPPLVPRCPPLPLVPRLSPAAPRCRFSYCCECHHRRRRRRRCHSLSTFFCLLACSVICCVGVWRGVCGQPSLVALAGVIPVWCEPQAYPRRTSFAGAGCKPLPMIRHVTTRGSFTWLLLPSSALLLLLRMPSPPPPPPPVPLSLHLLLLPLLLLLLIIPFLHLPLLLLPLLLLLLLLPRPPPPLPPPPRLGGAAIVGQDGCGGNDRWPRHGGRCCGYGLYRRYCCYCCGCCCGWCWGCCCCGYGYGSRLVPSPLFSPILFHSTPPHTHTHTHTHTPSHNHSHCLIWPPRIKSSDGQDEDQQS